MRGTVAKRLRRIACPDMARTKQTYINLNGPFLFQKPTGKMLALGIPETIDTIIEGTRVCTGLREQYISLKAAYRRNPKQFSKLNYGKSSVV